MLNVLFFAQTRELIGEDSIQLKGDFATAEAVREHLAQKGDRWALALEKREAFSRYQSNLDATRKCGQKWG